MMSELTYASLMLRQHKQLRSAQQMNPPNHGTAVTSGSSLAKRFQA